MLFRTIESTPHLRVLVPHPITICADERLGTPQYNDAGVGLAETPRATTTLKSLANIAVEGWQSQLFGASHGMPERLPDPQEDTFLVVSKLTISAAMRAGRPIDDLLFLYGDIRDEHGEFVGVRGLGQPQPVPRPPFRSQTGLDRAALFGRRTTNVHVVNTCPYPAKFFDPATPEFVPFATEPQLYVPKATTARQTRVQYAEELQPILTEQLAVPVYKTWVTGVENAEQLVSQETTGDRLFLANPNVPVALGLRSWELGLVTFVQDVRSQERSSIIGGRALAFFDRELLMGPCI